MNQLDIKQLQFDDEVRKSLFEGVRVLAQAVKSTLGPSGRNVILQKKHGNLPVSTKDGVSVAKEIKLGDPFQDLGAQILKEAALRTATHAGDGTTTSTVIAYNLFHDACMKLQENKQLNAIVIKRELDKLLQQIVTKIANSARRVTTNEEIKAIATVSANNDPSIGALIANALLKVGRDGVIHVEEGKTSETVLDIVEGLQFKRGYSSPYFVTDQSKFTAVLEDCVVVVTDASLNTFDQIRIPAEFAQKNGRPLLIIADKIDGEALATLVVNKMRGVLKVCAVQSPEFGEQRRQALEDIALATGATFLSQQRGVPYPDSEQDWDPAWFGSATKIIVSRTDTTIVEGKGDDEAIREKVVELKQQMNDSSLSPLDKEKIQNRLARLIGGVAVIRVGAHTEVEMKEKRDRIDDAVQATKAAIEEGIVPGGGRMLAEIAFGPVEETDNEEEIIARDIMRSALLSPLKTILSNAGISLDDQNVILKETQRKHLWDGYNVMTGQFQDLYESGLLDPAKVTRVALENAVSVAGTLMTTAAAVIIDPEKNKPVPQEIDPSMFQ